MQNTKKLLISLSVRLAIFSILIIPAFSFAQTPPTTPPSGLVPCDNTPSKDSNDNIILNSDSTPKIDRPCDFNALMTLVNNITKFVFYALVIPIAAIMFAYAGFELLTSGDSTEKRGTARRVFTEVLIGLILAAAAFLIIRTILSILGYEGSWLGFDPY